MRRRFWATPAPDPLPPATQQRLDGWVAMLDVDVDLAQRMLRLPTHRLPVPPLALPAVLDWNGDVLVPAVEAADPSEPVTEAPKPVVGLRGAYARRAANRQQVR